MKAIAKRVLSLCLCFLILCSLFSCKKEEKFSKTYLEYFDTVTTLTVANVEKSEFLKASEFVEAELERYHKLFDIYNLYEGINNIKLINDNAGISPVGVSDELIEFLDYSIELHDTTRGYFNIALGSVLKLWRECREEAKKSPEAATIPSVESLESASAHTDIKDIDINVQDKTVFLKDKDMSLDVGAIAKGFATQRVYDGLRELGYKDFVLSIGGNVIASGKKNDSSPWQVAIENPSDTTKNLHSLSLSEKSLVTSGSYQRYYTVGNEKYHHIINPYSLAPENIYLSVSVLHEDSALADAMSTALFNMTYELGSDLVKNFSDLEVMWVLKDGNIRYTDNFLSYVNS